MAGASCAGDALVPLIAGIMLGISAGAFPWVLLGCFALVIASFAFVDRKYSTLARVRGTVARVNSRPVPTGS